MNGSPSKKITYRAGCSRKEGVWGGKSGEGLTREQAQKRGLKKKKDRRKSLTEKKKKILYPCI